MTPLLRPVRLASAVVVALALALTACGGDSEGEGTTTTTAPADDTTTTADDGGATASDEPGTEEGDGPDEAPDGLAAVLLTVDDLPAGFAVADGEPTSLELDRPMCAEAPAVEAAAPVEQVGRELNDDQEQLFVGSFALRYDQGGAATVLEHVRGEVARCEGMGSGPQTYTLTELAGLGDEVVHIGLGGATSGLWVARVGDVLLAVSAFGDGLDGEGLLGLMVDRL